MKLVLFAFILLLRGNPSEGSESDVEQLQDTVQNLLNRIETLEERLDSSEKERKKISQEVNELKHQSRRNDYPYVIFSVFQEGDYIDEGSPITFDGTVENTGNCVDISTGIFTAPYDGLYHFSFSATAGGRGHKRVAVQINGETDFNIYTYEDLDGSSISYTWIFSLKNSDQVNLKVMDGLIVGLPNYCRATFSGQLIKLL